MNQERFWRLVARIDWKRRSEEARVTPLVRALAKLDVEEIAAFHEELAQKLRALDTARHFDAAGESQSADAFLYARLYVVGRGKYFYSVVLKQPERMPASLDLWLEPLLYVARRAHLAKTGQARDFDTTVSFESFTNPRFGLTPTSTKP